uniref:Uncharacterized protein n=1 Tax=Arundo donax TaxID=35708 RepID=A0A0A8Z4C1_ARUDO
MSHACSSLQQRLNDNIHSMNVSGFWRRAVQAREPPTVYVRHYAPDWIHRRGRPASTNACELPETREFSKAGVACRGQAPNFCRELPFSFVKYLQREPAPLIKISSE